MRRRRTAAAVLALLAAGGLAGCGTRSNTGVAARVGAHAISTQRLAGIVDRSLAITQFRSTINGDEAGVVRAKLFALIRESLLDEAARRLGVTVTDADVQEELDRSIEYYGSLDELERQAAQQGVAARDVRPFFRAVVLEKKVGVKLTEDEAVPDADLRKAYDENIREFDRVHVLQVQVRDRAQADEVARRARAGEDFGALAREFSIHLASKERGGDLGFVGLHVSEAALDKVLFATLPGTIGGPVQTSEGWHVVKVLEHRVTPYADAARQIRERLLAEKIQQATEAYITTLSRDVRITVNPRFGEWDSEEATIVPRRDDLSSPAPSKSPEGRQIVPPLGGVPQPTQSP